MKLAYADEPAEEDELSRLVADLEDSATLCTSREASSRYDDDFIETRRNVDRGISHAQRLADACAKRRSSAE